MRLIRSKFDTNQLDFPDDDSEEDMKGLTIRSTTPGSPAGDEVLVQPQFEYATLVADVDVDVATANFGPSSPSSPAGANIFMRTTPTSNESADDVSSPQRSSPLITTTTTLGTTRPAAGSTQTQDHPHMSHGNASVGLYLVMGEGLVLILWLVLFTSIVCYSQYRKYHIAKRRSRNAGTLPAAFDGKIANRLVGHPGESGQKKTQSQPSSCSNFQYLNAPHQSVLLNLAEASSASSVTSQEVRSQPDRENV